MSPVGEGGERPKKWGEKRALQARESGTNNGREKEMCLRSLGLGERPDLAAAENVMARHKDKVHNSQLCLFIWDSSSQSRMMTLYG